MIYPKVSFMAKAIVYTSNTGYTEEYAHLLGEETGLPVYSLKDAADSLERNSGIIYLGWLMAGTVKGFKKAAGRYNIEAVCGVGMGATGSQTSDLRKTNKLPEALPVFTLQGGYAPDRLRGVYRFMMTIMSKTLGKAIAGKQNRTPEEEDMLELLQNGGNRVGREQLKALLDWYGSASKESDAG